MAVKTTFLHPHPQQEIASKIRWDLDRCKTAQIVTGFATPDGINALGIGPTSRKISRFVLGAGTFDAFEALDKLITAGMATDAARVHLGHTHPTGGGFARNRPMLHSKIYFFEMADGTATVYVGSNNLTGFALRGFNGEAAVCLEGIISSSIFFDIRMHIEESYKQSIPYDPTLKEEYARWHYAYLRGLESKMLPPPDYEQQRTIILAAPLVLSAQAPTEQQPRPGDRIYFELDKRITQVSVIGTEVHLHLFETMPLNPWDALSRSGTSDTALLGKADAIDAAAGTTEVEADWYIDDPRKPQLQLARKPFRPARSPNKQQVCACVNGILKTKFSYLFEGFDYQSRDERRLEPILETNGLSDNENNIIWWPITGFKEMQPVDHQPMLPGMEDKIQETNPESGSFILFSGRRRGQGDRN